MMMVFMAETAKKATFQCFHEQNSAQIPKHKDLYGKRDYLLYYCYFYNNYSLEAILVLKSAIVGKQKN